MFPYIDSLFPRFDLSHLDPKDLIDDPGQVGSFGFRQRSGFPLNFSVQVDWQTQSSVWLVEFPSLAFREIVLRFHALILGIA